jgi:hypothetical protein
VQVAGNLGWHSPNVVAKIEVIREQARSRGQLARVFCDDLAKGKFQIRLAAGKRIIKHFAVALSPHGHHPVSTKAAEQLTYAGIAERLGISTEAAGAVANAIV